MASQFGNKSGDIEISETPEVVHVRPKRGLDSRDDSPTSIQQGAGPAGSADYYAEYDSKAAHGTPQIVGAREAMVGPQDETRPVTLMEHWKNARKGWGAYIKTKDFWIVLALG